MRGHVLNDIHGGLVVSCQAPPGDPLRDTAVIARLARSVELGGAVGVRVNGVDDVAAVRTAVTVPVVGLWKDGDRGVYITPTARHALDVVYAGAHIVAVDATLRPRPDGRTFTDTVTAVHATSDALVLADVSTGDEGIAAADAGADAVATTLSGYTPGSTRAAGPDLELVERLALRLDVPVIAEGRLHTNEDVRRAFDAGAWAVVLGNAITSPRWITAQLAVETPRARPSHARIGKDD